MLKCQCWFSVVLGHVEGIRLDSPMLISGTLGSILGSVEEYKNWADSNLSLLEGSGEDHPSMYKLSRDPNRRLLGGSMPALPGAFHKSLDNDARVMERIFRYCWFTGPDALWNGLKCQEAARGTGTHAPLVLRGLCKVVIMNWMFNLVMPRR